MDIGRDASSRWTHRLGWALTALYALAHLLILVALVAFGLRAGGWVFPPLAVAWYGFFVLGSVVPLTQARRQENAHWLLVIPVLLALALMGASGATWSIGEAVYGPYDPGDRYRSWALLQAGVGVALVSLAALYRWPSLLRAGLFAQVGLILSNPEEWAGLAVWGWPQAGTILLPFLVALYAAALWALGERLPFQWTMLLKTGGIGAALGAVFLVIARFLAVDILHRGAATTGYLPTLSGSLILGGLGVPALLLAAPSLKPTESRKRFPAEAAALLSGIAALLTLSIGQFPPMGILPTPGEILPWAPHSHPVPDVWLPTVEWAGWLLKAVLALQVPLGLWGLWSLWVNRRVRWAFPETPLMLAGGGLMLLSLWEILSWAGSPFLVWAFLRFVRLPLTHPLPFYLNITLPERLLSILAGVLLLLAGRAVAAHPAARWEEWARPLGRSAVLGLLLFGVGWTGTATRDYLRILTAFPPTWKSYLTSPASWLSLALGALLYLLLLALFAATTGFLLSAWWRNARKGTGGLRGLWPHLVLPTLLISLAGGLVLWALWPRVLSTVPPNGAQGVPTDTPIQIQMRSPTPLTYLLPGAGQVLFVWYTDTGDFVHGSIGFGEDFVSFFPYEPLRPDASVEVVARRGWERPYRLRFTTAGPDASTATPILTPTHPAGSVPTALPTATP
ncbi:MAG: Ig-like domain-containing protein [Anaerolineae bacterium]|nr:Ig-like domain-containing protein [Anaerolineae bacterium]